MIVALYDEESIVDELVRHPQRLRATEPTLVPDRRHGGPAAACIVGPVGECEQEKQLRAAAGEVIPHLREDSDTHCPPPALRVAHSVTVAERATVPTSGNSGTVMV